MSSKQPLGGIVTTYALWLRSRRRMIFKQCSSQWLDRTKYTRFSTDIKSKRESKADPNRYAAGRAVVNPMVDSVRKLTRTSAMKGPCSSTNRWIIG
jgi:hypothetical protein